MGGRLNLFRKMAISTGGCDHIFVTPHPNKSHPISLSPCVHRGIVGHIDTHIHTHIRSPTEENISQAAHAPQYPHGVMIL